MFENPGQKVKTFASVLFVISVLLGLIGAILSAVAADSFWSFLLIFGASLLGAYLTSLFLYGSGELIDSTQENLYTNKAILAKLNRENGETSLKQAPSSAYRQSSISQNAYGAPAQNGKWMCSCGRINDDYVSTCTCGRNKRDVKTANQ